MDRGTGLARPSPSAHRLNRACTAHDEACEASRRQPPRKHVLDPADTQPPGVPSAGRTDRRSAITRSNEDTSQIQRVMTPVLPIRNNAE
jgi:hypothetical protein